MFVLIQVLQSLHDRFKNVVCMEGFKKRCHDEEIRNEILSLLESLCGVAEATRVDNVALLFNFLHPILTESIRLLGKFKKYLLTLIVLLCWMGVSPSYWIDYLQQITLHCNCAVSGV